MRDLLEDGLFSGPDVEVILARSEDRLLFADPAKTAAIASRVVTAIKERVAAAAGQPVTGTIPIPELGLTAMLHDAGPVCVPGMRVTCEPPLTDDQRDHHWKMAALQIKDPIEKKGRKTYGLPSIVVLDVSRLGSAGEARLRHRGRASSRTYWMTASSATSAARWWCVLSWGPTSCTRCAGGATISSWPLL